MKKTILSLLVLSVAVPGQLRAQSAEQAVMEVVHGLFEAMSRADSAEVRSLFHPEAHLIATGAGEDGAAVRIIPAERFIDAVGGGSGWNERIWDWEVRLDDKLAIVWTQYDFHRGEEFSHCGVDAFMLANTGDGWKIVSLADTRRSEECQAPPEN